MSDYGYGLWAPVVFNSLVVIVFAASWLAIREEREVADRFGSQWERFAAQTPRFVPRARSTRLSGVPVPVTQEEQRNFTAPPRQNRSL